MKRSAPQPLRMKPLTGSFDARSLPELVAPEVWRLLQNTRTTARGKLCRLPGWEKFLAGVATNRSYNNEDLHDQLLTLQTYYEKLTDVDDTDVTVYPPNNAMFGTVCGTTLKTRTQGRQPITFGTEVTSSMATRHCVVGTQSRLYAMNFGLGNWKIIADGMGGTSSNPEIRFQSAALGDYVVFTNNFDELVYWKIDQQTFGCGQQSVQTIPELQEIGVTKVACIASFKGTLFMADVEQDGERRRNRIIWSRYQSPLEVVEDPGASTAGTQDLDYGESIIAMKELGDFLYIYTDRAIWVTLVVGDASSSFGFVRKYRAQKGDGTLVYPFTLTASKDSHYYASTDGIYEWNPYITAPVRQEWIHQAMSLAYDNLNKSACAAHTAGYSPTDKELWFSFAQGTSKIPSVTITCNTDYGQCSKVDHGFTALFTFTPDTRESIRDWLIRNCIADDACLNDPELLALGISDPKVGPGVALTHPTCTSLAQHVFTDQPKTILDVTTEDYDQTEAHAQSICAMIPDGSVADGCQNCEAGMVFVGASAADNCLKSIGTIYARERYVLASNTYVSDVYDTVMLKGPMMFGSDLLKKMDRVSMEFDAEPQTIPSRMKLRVGACHRCDDPLDSCAINWYEEEDRPIQCVDDDRNMEWPVDATEVALYLEFKISGTGGASCYSSLQVNVGTGGCQ